MSNRSHLDALLVRVQSKIESRTRRPWYDLQRHYFYKSNNGIRSISDLRSALDHFHVLLSDPDYTLLFSSFPNSDGSFDFRSFAARLYPKEAGLKLVKEGRVVEDVDLKNFNYNGKGFTATNNNNSNSNNNNTNNNGATNSLPVNLGASNNFNSQQPIYYPGTDNNAFTYTNPPPGSTIYDERSNQFVTIPGNGNNTGAFSSTNSNNNPSSLSLVGNSIVQNDLQYPVLGETLGPQGTTTYYTTLPNATTANNNNSLTLTSGSSKKKNNSSFRPRITYNRLAHQRFSQFPFDDFTAKDPRPQGYPEEEYKGHGRFQSTLNKPRFDLKAPQTFVEVSRRHNISRQYNRA